MNFNFIKQRFLDRAKIAGYLFALVGWFMLFVIAFGSMFEEQLLRLESFVESETFLWGFRVAIIALAIVLYKGRGWFGRLRKERSWLEPVLRGFLIGGAIGWIVGLGSLLF